MYLEIRGTLPVHLLQTVVWLPVPTHTDTHEPVWHYMRPSSHHILQSTHLTLCAFSCSSLAFLTRSCLVLISRSSRLRSYLRRWSMILLACEGHVCQNVCDILHFIRNITIKERWWESHKHTIVGFRLESQGQYFCKGVALIPLAGLL